MEDRLTSLLETVRYSAADLNSIAVALAADKIDAATVRLYRRCLHRAVLRLARMQNYRARVPEFSFVERLDGLAKAADLVARYGCAMLASKPSAGAELSRLVQGKLPRRSPARFRRSAAALIKLLPADEDCPLDQFPDRALAIALTTRGAKSDRTLNRIVEGIAGYGQNVKVATIASALLARRAHKSAETAMWVRKTTVGLGHTGDAAFNGWIDDMLSLYEKITGRPVRTAVKSGSEFEGDSYGPVIEFLKAAIGPINQNLREAPHSHESYSPGCEAWSLSEQAWRSRIRVAQRARAEKDAAIVTWIDGMLSFYEKCTEKPVTGPLDWDDIAYIPLIDFMKEAASGPLGKEFWALDDWRRRIRTARAQKRV